MSDEELLLFNEIYNQTQHFGRTQFVREIMKLQQENKELKEHIKKYEHYCKTTGIEELMQENKKYKEVIDKAIELNKQVIKDTKEFYRPTKDIIYSGDTLIDIAEQNLKILKEVE